MTIAHNHFYSGHGMSIGSETNGGVNAIRVSDLSIDGADNGIRIKSDRSRGGVVEDVVYENVCLRDVSNPIVLTSMYTTFPGDKLPVYRNILLKDVHSVTPGRLTFLGLDATHKIDVTFDNVTLDGQRDDHTRTENADIKRAAHAGTPLSCEGRFPPFPAISTAPSAAVTVPAEDKTLYVASTGTGDFYSIQRAIDVAPPEGAVISVTPGIYREVLTITKPNIHIRSPYADPSKAVIVFDKSAGSTGSTLKSTVNVLADNFTAENLTFANDFNASHPQEPQGSQALALLVTGDRAVFRNVRVLGNQDTLYAGSKSCAGAQGKQCVPARQYFSGCYIEGNVDFIFGDGKAVFDNCEIHSTKHSIGFITAQGKHYPEQDSAFVFNQCKLTAEAGVRDVWLGRPWRPYATVVFLNAAMGDHVAPAGWREWHPGETHSIDTAFYAEYNSSGPGAHADDRDSHVKKLMAEEAARYEANRFLAGSDGWTPAR